jgi:hypothetical protein
MLRAHARVICNSLRCGMDACCHTLNHSRSSAETTVFTQAVRFRLRDNCADESLAVQPQGGGDFSFGRIFHAMLSGGPFARHADEGRWADSGRKFSCRRRTGNTGLVYIDKAFASAAGGVGL